MALSQAQKLAKAKYQQEKRSLIAAEVSKAKGKEYKQKAASLGLSLSALIQRSIESYGANHAGEEFMPPTPAPMTADERKLIEEFNALPDDVRKSISKLIRQINQAQAKH